MTAKKNILIAFKEYVELAKYDLTKMQSPVTLVVNKDVTQYYYTDNAELVKRFQTRRY